MFWRNLVLAAALTCMCVTASAQQAGRRVALVIGNSAYATQGTLANPGPDSRLVADALRRVGFTVVPVSNAGKQAMERSLRDFSRQADGAEVALVYYAGHGLEANGVNWLLPVDAALADERDLSFEAISLDTVLATVERARGLRMVVLDACRNNPFTRSMRRGTSSTRSVTRGLADVEVTGTLVLYAARGGTVAQDGAPGGNSPFAAAFARRVPEPGVDIRLLVSKVRDDVLAATDRAQEPFSYGSLPGVEMALVAGSASSGAYTAAPAALPFALSNLAVRGALNGLWIGTHSCGVQVPIQASIEVDRDGTISGVREFNNSGTYGSFRISGRFDEQSGELTFVAGDWITQPPGFTKCTIRGQLSQRLDEIRGTTSACGCEGFTLRRQ